MNSSAKRGSDEGGFEVPQSLESDETLEEQPEAAWSGCAPYANPVSIVKRQSWSTMTPRPAPAGVQSAPLQTPGLEANPLFPRDPRNVSPHHLVLRQGFHLTTCRIPQCHGLWCEETPRIHHIFISDHITPLRLRPGGQFIRKRSGVFCGKQ
ncbi:uncharacterized [Tachysurus ichikawai]